MFRRILNVFKDGLKTRRVFFGEVLALGGDGLDGLKGEWIFFFFSGIVVGDLVG